MQRPRNSASTPRTRFSRERGAVLVEFALVVPVLMTILIGAFWIGRALSVYQALERAAREGARIGAAPHCALCGNGVATDLQIETAVKSALSAASLDTTNPGLVVAVAYNQPLNPSAPVNYRSSGVQVTVSYPVQLNIPFTRQNATTVNLTSSVSMRQEF
jgi:Flp pilus assembly protein TadG